MLNLFMDIYYFIENNIFQSITKIFIFIQYVVTFTYSFKEVTQFLLVKEVIVT